MGGRKLGEIHISNLVVNRSPDESVSDEMIQKEMDTIYTQVSELYGKLEAIRALALCGFSKEALREFVTKKYVRDWAGENKITNPHNTSIPDAPSVLFFACNFSLEELGPDYKDNNDKVPLERERREIQWKIEGQWHIPWAQPDEFTALRAASAEIVRQFREAAYGQQ